jgi:hypothetical protein
MGIVDVSGDLLDESVDTGKLHLAAELLDEADLDEPSVEVALEIEDIALQSTLVVPKGRPLPQIRNAAIELATGANVNGVDPVRRKNEATDAQVRGRKSQRLAAVMPMHHPAADAHGVSEKRLGAVDVTGDDGATDSTAADFDSTRLDRADHLDLEATLMTQAPQELRPPLALMSERHSMTDDDLPHAKAGDQ